MKKNLVFVDYIAWSKIEAALSANIRVKHASVGYPVIHTTKPEGLSGVRGWSALILYDEEQNPIYIMPGGQEAEDKFYDELETNVRVANHDQNIQP